MFFLPSSMEDYKKRQHLKIDGKLTTRDANDAENEARAKHVLSQHFRSSVTTFSDDTHCKIDFCIKDQAGDLVALFEFKKRGNNHNDYCYKSGYWIPIKKLNELVRYGVHERRQSGKPCILNLFYCWGFNDAFLYINIHEAKAWLFDIVDGGLSYYVKEKQNGGREEFYLVPRDNKFIKKISHVGIDMPWRYGHKFYPWH